jgi:SSS family solute:Na+ symporter
LPAELQQEVAAGKGDNVFPFFIVANLPTGFTGLLIAAIFAAAMSTLSGSLNGAATLTLTDLYKRFLRPQAGERESMAVLYSSTVAWGVIGTGTALAMIHVKSALDAWWNLASICSGGMLGLFLLGLISRRAKNAAAATGVAVGLLVIFWMTFSPEWTYLPEALRSPLHNFLVVVIGTLAILLVGLVVTKLSGHRPATDDIRFDKS